MAWRNSATSSILDSEVLVNDCVVHFELGGGAVMPHGTLFHDVDALARGESKRHVLLHQQDRNAFPVQHLDDLADLRDHPRHQAFGGFIKKNDLRLEHHRPRDRKHLLLAPREGPAGLIATFGQYREITKDLREELLPASLAHPATIETGAQVLHDREKPENAPVFRNIGDPDPRQPVRRQAGDDASFVHNLAPTWTDEPHDRLERGALADAVAPEKANNLSPTHFQRDAMENVALAVVGVDVLNVDKGSSVAVRRVHVLRYTSCTRGLPWMSAGLPSASTRP